MMDSDTPLHAPFDRGAVKRQRDRRASSVSKVEAILHDVADRLLDRLDDISRTFSLALDIGGRGVMASKLQARHIKTISCDLSDRMLRHTAPAGAVCADEEALPFATGSFDLVVANLSLHWVNDLPGTLIQIRNMLRPDGLFLATLPIWPGLSLLRKALEHAELAQGAGLSARVAPLPDLKLCAALLQRAGFALPVADMETVELAYRSGAAVLNDLRNAGESNALASRSRRIPPAALFAQAIAFMEEHAQADGYIHLPLPVATLTGWAPHPSQPRPLRPGAFSIPLEEALEKDAP